jgi:hypothetical protein
MILTVNGDYFPNSINKLIVRAKKFCVFFAVRNEYLDDLRPQRFNG